MLALIGAVFIASLVGSTHCAGMCGAFVAFAVAGPDQQSRRNGVSPSRAQLHMACNTGRLIVYVALGMAAGAVGGLLDVGGSIVGVQRAAAMLAGACMAGYALVALARLAGARLPRVPLPGVLQRALLTGHRAVFAWPARTRALAVGLLTTLLPCGWLYAFVITSAGTGSPAWGAATMAVFWLGTLPMLVGIGAGAAALTGPLRARLPVVTNVLLLTVGILTLAGRFALPPAPTAFASELPTGAAGALKQLEHATRPEGMVCHDR